MKKAVFLDRDGVINRKAEEGEYVTRWEDFELLPGVAEAIANLNRAGWLVVVASNQRCVAKGLLSIPGLEEIHRKMVEELAGMGAKIDAVYYCPHEKEPACSCRKPLPGMLLAAAKDHQIELGQSWMIGDSDIDIEAGRRAGCRTLRIVTGHFPESEGGDRARSLTEASRKVLACHPRDS